VKQEMTFRDRHIGLSDDERTLMLDTLGLRSMDELSDRVVPENIRKRTGMSLPQAISEHDALIELKTIRVEKPGGSFVDWAGLLPHADTCGDSA
jgi:glycine cleavage system pyridoxal-binding protein P